SGPIQPPPLVGAEQVDGVVPNPANVVRDLGHLLGFVGSGRCEWRQDGGPYKRSIVALGKALGYRDGAYAETLWDIAVAANLVIPLHRPQPPFEPATVGEVSPSDLFSGLLAGWVEAGVASLAPGASGYATEAARMHLLELLRLMPADTWVLRSSV